MIDFLKVKEDIELKSERRPNNDRGYKSGLMNFCYFILLWHLRTSISPK